MKSHLLLSLLVLLGSFTQAQTIESDTLTPFESFKSENADTLFFVFEETNILFEISKENTYLDTIRYAQKKRRPLIISYSEDNRSISKAETIDVSDEDIFNAKYRFEEFAYQDNKSLKRNETKLLRTIRRVDNELPEIIPIDSLTSIFNYFKSISCERKRNCRASNPCIPFDYKIDGCYARAHWMSKLISEKYGYSSKKIFVTGKLRAINSGTCKDKCVRWGYHVAPLVKVKTKEGKVEKMVIDPSLYDQPVSIKDWISAQESKCPSLRSPGKHKKYWTTPAAQLYPSGGIDPNYKITKKVMKKYCRKCR